ncbi:putative leucine-rich repeat receptor-like protein kinase isoform X2 [Cinnamomum micranthum f. kanehirae]|uniref:Putative leucine-rich repeat receptor-like protein kinase isoform X2 n=1 Tax=Cinnamomum micranthum f. kanehirae TaxID=337451 RepID=A0A3S3M6U4_9MAGN|nr:putative leucine-rich repeat receptor-like protein kinase isoform X2 [Cinnamomum micranthum f. kanehirae]
MCRLTKKNNNKTTASAHGFGFYTATVKKDQGDCSLSSKNQQFTYAEIINMTSNFERIIGKGAFGTVYYGKMQDGTQVAVKMLSEEYCNTNKLTEKSDVYSFGIVLLELITGQHAIIRSSNSDAINIKDWASPLFAGGDINYGPDSVWKAVEIAMACTPLRSIERPTMSHVVTKLKEYLETELAWERSRIMNSVQAEMDSSTSLYLPR